MTDQPSTLTLSGRRVLVGQVVVKLALFATYAALVSVLLPTRVAELDSQNKVAVLGGITTIGFIVNAVAQPVVGALSDRTRTRFGRRLPWMAGGAVVGGLAIGSIGGVPSILALALLWPIGQLALHGLEVSADAYLVDAFPPTRRGFAAGVVGVALVVGTALGTVLAGSLVNRPMTATWLLAGGVVLAVIVFAALVRDAPLTAPPVPRRRAAEAIRLLASTAAAHPDFTKILLWRFGYSIAYGSVFAYLLYILTDLVLVPGVEAARLIGILTGIAGCASVVTVLVGGWLSDRMGRRRVFIIIGSVVIVLGDVLLLMRPTVATVLVAAGLFGLGLGLSISCGRALASLLLPNPEAGAAAGLGMLNTAANIGQAAAPAVGALAISLGGYPTAFIVSLGGAVVSSVAASLVRSVR